MTHLDATEDRGGAAYDEFAELFDVVWARYSARFAADLIDLMSPQHGEAALDIAGGSGAAGLKVAERVGPRGQVVIADISPGMLRIAARHAAARKLENVEIRVLDAEQLDLPAASFDLVTCSFGLMYLTDPGRALRHVRRVLRPGGRLGVAVWSIPSRTPFISSPLRAAVRHAAPLPVRWLARIPWLGATLVDRVLVGRLPTGPAPGSLGSPGRLERLVADAGLELVRREPRAFPIEFESFSAYWDALCSGTPARELVRRLRPAVLDSVRRETRDAVADARTGRVLLHNEALLVVARNPA